MEEQEPKSGIKTSEFWLTMIPTVLGAIIAITGLMNNDTELLNTGAALSGVPVTVYTGVRGFIKRLSAPKTAIINESTQ